MTRFEEEYYYNIKRITVAIEDIAETLKKGKEKEEDMKHVLTANNDIIFVVRCVVV